MPWQRRLAALCLAVAALSGDSTRFEAAPASVTRRPFGQTADGTAVELFTLASRDGVEVRAMTYGAILVSIRTPARDGSIGDIALGFDTLDDYLARPRYFGAVIGRYGNRIANGRFSLDGQTFQLATNNGANHLHGGVKGFDKVVWTAEPFERAGNVGLILTYTSRDGEEGYPGTLTARVTYSLSPANELKIDYDAATDRPTHVNLTQHTYFNLAGAGSGDVLRHHVTIDADRYTPVDAGMIPTGALAPVGGTPFDFRTASAIGARIDGDHPQLRLALGYDHNFVLNGRPGELRHAARVAEPSSGRTLDVATTEPGMQFYTGNRLTPTPGKEGRTYGPRGGFCLETQHYPDSPNQPAFPSTVVRPGQPYRSQTVFTFGVQP